MEPWKPDIAADRRNMVMAMALTLLISSGASIAVLVRYGKEN